MIKSYTVYEISTGEILSHISADEQTVLLNLSDGQGYIEGTYHPKREKIVNNSVVDKDTSSEDAERNYQLFIRKRNALLMQSDWTQVSDAPVDQAAWAEYRQALRDLPENTVDPANPVWPTKP